MAISVGLEALCRAVQAHSVTVLGVATLAHHSPLIASLHLQYCDWLLPCATLQLASLWRQSGWFCVFASAVRFQQERHKSNSRQEDIFLFTCCCCCCCWFSWFCSLMRLRRPWSWSELECRPRCCQLSICLIPPSHGDQHLSTCFYFKIYPLFEFQCIFGGILVHFEFWHGGVNC